MARQLSIQRETCAPVASSARKRAGTATLPFASIECRNSPVNTPLPLDRSSHVGAVHHPGVLSLPRLGRSPLLLPTCPHFGPLRGMLRHSSATSSPFVQSFWDSVAMAANALKERAVRRLVARRRVVRRGHVHASRRSGQGDENPVASGNANNDGRKDQSGHDTATRYAAHLFALSMS